MSYPAFGDSAIGSLETRKLGGFPDFFVKFSDDKIAVRNYFCSLLGFYPHQFPKVKHTFILCDSFIDLLIFNLIYVYNIFSLAVCQCEYLLFKPRNC